MSKINTASIRMSKITPEMRQRRCDSFLTGRHSKKANAQSVSGLKPGIFFCGIYVLVHFFHKLSLSPFMNISLSLAFIFYLGIILVLSFSQNTFNSTPKDVVTLSEATEREKMRMQFSLLENVTTET